MSSKVGGSFLEPKPNKEPIFTPAQFTVEEQEMFDTAEKFCDEKVWPQRSAIASKEPGLMPALMREASGLGLTMLDIPEAYGGLELPVPASMRVLEKSSREPSFMLTLMVQNGIGSLPVVLFGDEQQKEHWLPQFAEGKKMGCYCLTEPGSGSDALAATTTARLSDEGEKWILNGTKQFITNAGWAHVGFVFAQVKDKVDGRSGFSCFIVPFDAPGVSLGEEEDKLGMRGSSTRQVILEDALIPAANVLGEIGRGHIIAFNILNNGRYKLGGTALGSAKAAFNEAIQYASNRKQFGQPVISFGMMKRKVGQMTADLFAVESALYRLCGDMEEDARNKGYDAKAKLAALHNYALECSIAKVAGSELLGRVADESLQMFGGYGFLEEYPAAGHMRDARIARIYEGTNEINRIVMPRTLMKKIAAGEVSLNRDSSDGDRILAMKALHADLLNRALSTLGEQQLDQNQELMANFADMMIAIYLTESTRLRVAQCDNAQATHRAVDELVCAQAEAKIRQLAQEISNHLGGTSPLLEVDLTDTLSLRQQIADQVIEEGCYRL